MDAPAQAQAYAEADFSEPHDLFVELFRESFPDWEPRGFVLDLGCGPGDVTLRFARAFPRCRLHGVDGAEAMLSLGWKAVTASGLAHRVLLIQGYIPNTELPRRSYDAVISNSLLHHLADPMALWSMVNECANPGAPVFVMDLLRPDSEAHLDALVGTYAADAPEVLRHDFRASLGAAYRLDEVYGQIEAASLDYLRARIVSDRHFVVSGRNKD